MRSNSTHKLKYMQNISQISSIKTKYRDIKEGVTHRFILLIIHSTIHTQGCRRSTR